MIDKIHPYSGVDPEAYKRFVDNLYKFKQITSKENLELAIHELYNIEYILNTSSSGYSITEDIKYITKECDYISLQDAINKGTSHYPTYLNNN